MISTLAMKNPGNSLYTLSSECIVTYYYLQIIPKCSKRKQPFIYLFFNSSEHQESSNDLARQLKLRVVKAWLLASSRVNHQREWEGEEHKEESHLPYFWKWHTITSIALLGHQTNLDKLWQRTPTRMRESMRRESMATILDVGYDIYSLESGRTRWWTQAVWPRVWALYHFLKNNCRTRRRECSLFS